MIRGAKRLLNRMPESPDADAAAVSHPYPMPMHDRPSGYFSARDEGRSKNTVVSAQPVLSGATPAIGNSRVRAAATPSGRGIAQT